LQTIAADIGPGGRVEADGLGDGCGDGLGFSLADLLRRGAVVLALVQQLVGEFMREDGEVLGFIAGDGGVEDDSAAG
jgi:hypothetical protein